MFKRIAQFRSDSLRRLRAIARSAPKRFSALAAAEGRLSKASDRLGMNVLFHNMPILFKNSLLMMRAPCPLKLFGEHELRLHPDLLIGAVVRPDHVVVGRELRI